MSTREIIEKTRKARDEYNAAKERFHKAEQALAPYRPELPGWEALGEIYEMCGGKTYTQAYLFITVSILRFAPIAMLGGQLPLRLAKMLGEYLGITYNNIYMVRNKVVVWVKNYPDFYNEVDDIYKRLEM